MQTHKIEYPNREKALNKLTRFVVGLMLLGSTVLLASIAERGSNLVQGAQVLTVALVVLNLVFLVQIIRWSRGVLPMVAAVAGLVGLFAGVSAGAWFDRDSSDYLDPQLSHDLGVATIVLGGLQVAIFLLSILAFSQNWQEEVETVVTASGVPHPQTDAVTG